MAVSKKKKADSPEDESAFADLHPREGLLGVLLRGRRLVRTADHADAHAADEDKATDHSENLLHRVPSFREWNR